MYFMLQNKTTNDDGTGNAKMRTCFRVIAGLQKYFFLVETLLVTKTATNMKINL